MYLYERRDALKKRDELINSVINPPIAPVPDKRYVSLMSSISHTYGNALAFIQNWTMNLFPENMFKTIHVNSKIAHRQIRSTSKEYIKKTRPMIIFRPRVAGNQEDKFLKGTFLTERMTNMFSTYGGTNLQPFFDDPKNDMAIYYQLNREVMYVDVIVSLSTLMNQLDYYHYIENAVPIEHPFNLNTCLESYISPEMLKILSDIVGIPLYDDHGSTKEFLDYLNGNSRFPITYKLQGSTKSREFYRYYPAVIETTITDLDKDDGNKVGGVYESFNITFTIKMEFFSTGFYYLVSEKLYDLKLPSIDAENTDLIPVFTDVYLKEDLNLQQGWRLYNRASYRLENNNDTVNIDQMLSASIREAIKYYKENGLPLVDLIDIKLRKQGKIIHEFKDYRINYDNFDVHFINQDTYHTFSILICINVEVINNLMKIIYNLK